MSAGIMRKFINVRNYGRCCKPIIFEKYVLGIFRRQELIAGDEIVIFRISESWRNNGDELSFPAVDYYLFDDIKTKTLDQVPSSGRAKICLNDTYSNGARWAIHLVIFYSDKTASTMKRRVLYMFPVLAVLLNLCRSLEKRLFTIDIYLEIS